MKLLFLARSLNAGGAERQLSVLVRALRERGHEVSIAVFYAGGAFARELDGSGVALIDLGKSGRWDVARFGLRLYRTVRRVRPQAIYAFLGVPNMLTVLLKPFFRDVCMIWGVRASNVDWHRYGWLTQAAYALECRLARFADHVVCNSRAGMAHAARVGFPLSRMTVIANGIDTARFKADLEARAQVRRDWRIADTDILIGLPARLDPMKDHPTFLRAAAMLVVREPRARFACVGAGPTAYAFKLRQQAEELGLRDKVIWAGSRQDMPAVYSAFDIAVSCSSYGEGFSNTVAEAMACGLPCVVTDVGDSAEIAGQASKVVPPASPELLCGAVLEAVSALGDKRIDAAGRDRIREHYSVERMTEATDRLLQELIDGPRS